ncbi:hypothetical protein [Paenibacillus sp. RC67]|uniref:hypothetical protein n=1 Tax=Paenibacillus sp. RC67 TaxID=3039392 RepID=UPI0024AC8A29|nr:hypothetical protein [Paenibacillus sp. RC67]
MDPVILMMVVIIVLFALMRLRSTFRKTRQTDESEQIQRKLAELRRRKEEEDQ